MSETEQHVISRTQIKSELHRK